MKIKVPGKLYRNKLDKILGRVSPSLFQHYLFMGDSAVIEFAEKTGYFDRTITAKSIKNIERK